MERARARLEDGRFFWKTDLEATFDEWLEALDAITFFLGSGEKTRRISALCRCLPRRFSRIRTGRAGGRSKLTFVSRYGR